MPINNLKLLLSRNRCKWYQSKVKEAEATEKNSYRNILKTKEIAENNPKNISKAEDVTKVKEEGEIAEELKKAEGRREVSWKIELSQEKTWSCYY